eukprot:5281898-Amphidinium_carterae.1
MRLFLPQHLFSSSQNQMYSSWPASGSKVRLLFPGIANFASRNDVNPRAYDKRVALQLLKEGAKNVELVPQRVVEHETSLSDKEAPFLPILRLEVLVGFKVGAFH